MIVANIIEVLLQGIANEPFELADALVITSNCMDALGPELQKIALVLALKQQNIFRDRLKCLFNLIVTSDIEDPEHLNRCFRSMVMELAAMDDPTPARLEGRVAVVRALPTALAMGLVLLPRRDRDEVTSDLQDWYQEIAETRGHRWAQFFVAMKLASALGCQLLFVAERLAGIVGIARGQKKTE